MSLTLEERLALEKAVSEQVVRSIVDAGFSVSIDNGDEETPSPSTDLEDLLKQLRLTDEETVVAHTRDGRAYSHVFLVYGNEGWDVIADYGTRLEPVLAKAQRMCREAEEAHRAKHV